MESKAAAKYPRVKIDLNKLEFNGDTILSWCRGAGINAALVGKCVCEHEAVIRPLLNKGFCQVADSRLENLETVDTAVPKLLLRIGMPSEAERIVLSSDVSLQSSAKTITEISAAAKRLGRRHKIILMIDLGDLREGILFSDTDLIMKTAAMIADDPALELYGIGTNLTCYGSVVPDERNMGILCSIADDIRKTFSTELPIVSGGNSSSLRLLREGRMPKGINHLRIGEAVFLGTDTSTGKKFEELYDDAFILEAEIVEIYDKPSFPIGKRSVNAFGEVQEYEDRGIMHRGILAIGRQDVSLDNIQPLDSSVGIIGGSSDHLIVDLGSRKDLRVGDTLEFKLSYGGLLSCFTSRYVAKEVI